MTRWRAALRPESLPHTCLGGPLSGRRGWSWGPTPSVTLPQSFGAAWAEWSGVEGEAAAPPWVCLPGVGVPGSGRRSPGVGSLALSAQATGDARFRPRVLTAAHPGLRLLAATRKPGSSLPVSSLGANLAAQGPPTSTAWAPFLNSGGLLVPGAHPVPASTRRQRLLIHPVRTHVCFSSTCAFKCKHTHT